MSQLSPIDQLEALVSEIEHTAKLSPTSKERVPAALLEWSKFPKVAKDAIAYHRGHVTETTRILNSVVRLQKAFAEIYSTQSSRNKEWFEGTFPKFRPALKELAAYIKQHDMEH
jgi:hypothetical protein